MKITNVPHAYVKQLWYFTILTLAAQAHCTIRNDLHDDRANVMQPFDNKVTIY